MKPVIEDDALLRKFKFSQNTTVSCLIFCCFCCFPEIDLEEMALAHQPSSSTAYPSSVASNLQRRVNELESALQVTQMKLVSKQEALDKLFKEKYGSVEGEVQQNMDANGKGKNKHDAGYFESYSGNGA